MTMHRAKGTEFSKVALAGVGWSSDAEQRRLAALDPAERDDADLRSRSLVYVAATRAMWTRAPSSHCMLPNQWVDQPPSWQLTPPPP